MAYPLTSIIILTKNNIQFTERCLFSIFENVDSKLTPYEILILDENSIDGTKELCELHGIQYHNLPEFNSFAKRNNEGVRLAKGKYLWFLNNDVELLGENIAEMLKNFSNPKIGAVGNMHLFPDGSLNHIGMAFMRDLTPTHIFPNEDPTAPYINHGRYIDILTAASIIFRRDVFEEIGGFSEDYSWGFEDVDIMLKLKEKGYKAYCETEAKMIHFGQSTYGRKDDDNKNKKIFMDRWADKIKPNFDEIYKEKEEYLKNKKSLKKLPKRLIKGFLNSGISTIRRMKPKDKVKANQYNDIYIYKSPHFSAFRVVADLMEEVVGKKAMTISSLHDLKMVDNKNRSALLFSTTHFFNDYLSSTPDWIRDYRTFDINYERFDYSNPDYWIESIKNAKNMIVLASSEYCRNFLLESGADQERVFVVPHGYKKEVLEKDFEKENKKTEKITGLVIINTNDEVRYATDRLAESLKILKDKFPKSAQKLKLKIKNYGAHPSGNFFLTKEYRDLIESGIEVEYISRYLSDSEMIGMYYDSDFFIAPFRGEGFGMKIIDAAAVGLPIIATDYGGPKDYLKYAEHIPVKYSIIPMTEGIDREFLLLDESYVFADPDINDLAEKIDHTVNNITNLKKNALQKREYIRKNFSWEKKWERILEIDNKVKKKFEDNLEFKFFNPELSLDLKTSTHEKLKNIEQTLIINTIHPDNLIDTFEHIKINIGIHKLKGEILVVDDATGKDSSSLLKKFDDLPIRYISYSKWGGSGYAREVGLANAKGDNIIIIGDDIKPMPGFFEEHYNFYKKHPEIYALVGHVEWDKNIRNSPIAEFTTKYTEFQFGFEQIRNFSKIDYRKLVTPNLSFRKSDIEKLKLHFETGMILHEDTIWGKKFEHKGGSIYYLRRAYGLHNHQLKEGMEWLDWFTSRSYAIGNNMKAYAVDTSNEDFIEVEGTMEALRSFYRYHSEEELAKLAPVLDETIKNLKEQYLWLENREKKISYQKVMRIEMYDLLTNLYIIHRTHGVVRGINPNLPQEISRGLTYLFYAKFKADLPARAIDTRFKQIGLTEAAKLLLNRGRKRFPGIFEKVYKIGSKVGI